MKRFSLVIALLAAVAVLMAACTAVPPAADAPAEEGADDEVVTITFWDNQQTESGLSDFQQRAVDEFEAANPNIKVDVVTVPYPEYQQKLLLAVQSDSPPDISTVDQIWNSGFAVADAIQPLDEYRKLAQDLARD
jgi:ABC-type glycerol-3-phosphate transport system substrate-binding protein